MADVHDIDEQRPCLTVTVGSGDVHVIPLSVFQKITGGSLTVDELDSRDEIMRTVIAEWLYFVSKNSEE